jgi:hypothetical protein
MQHRSQREAVRREYPQLFDAVSAILYRLDPIRINYGVNPDEYDAEVGTILPRLETAASEDEALGIIHEEFVYWFGPGTAGPRERYQPAAAEIWRAWQESKRPEEEPDAQH